MALRASAGGIRVHAHARGEDACVLVELPSRPGQGERIVADTGWSLWTMAQLARQWDGDVSFERLDERSSRLVVVLPLAATVREESRA